MLTVAPKARSKAGWVIFFIENSFKSIRSAVLWVI
jgi:hypothetical protein